MPLPLEETPDLPMILETVLNLVIVVSVQWMHSVFLVCLLPLVAIATSAFQNFHGEQELLLPKHTSGQGLSTVCVFKVLLGS